MVDIVCMKGLKNLFEEKLTANIIAETFQFCMDYDDPKEIKRKMDEMDFDQYGVKNADKVLYGYIRKQDISEKCHTCKEYARTFLPNELIAENTPLIEVFKILRDRSFIFVLRRNEVNAILMKADFQKTPMRLFFFGLITILEMQVNKMIKDHFPGDTWKKGIGKKKRKEAEKRYKAVSERNEGVQAINFVGLCDKLKKLANDDTVNHILAYDDKPQAMTSIANIKTIRNNLAHSDDIIAGLDWSTFYAVIEDILRSIQILED